MSAAVHLADVRTGAVMPVEPARPPRFRLHVHCSPDATGWRALLVGDVVRRFGEALLDWQVTASCTAGGEQLPPAVIDALNIHPYEAEPPAAAPDLLVRAGDDATAADWHAGVVAAVAAVRAGDVGLQAAADRGLDPLAARLLLLRVPLDTPVDLDWPAMVAAHAELARWRAQLAGWARAPGAPMSVDAGRRVQAAFGDSLDAVTALRALDELADQTCPDGAKFETFAFADRLLGLDLARDVGRHVQSSAG